MTETIVLVVGIFVFALTVWGTVMAGSLTLSRRMDGEDELARKERLAES